MKEFVIILPLNSFQSKDCYTKKQIIKQICLCSWHSINIKNIKDIEDMDLFGVYIGIPDRYFRQYLQTIGIIFWQSWNKVLLDDLFPLHNHSLRKGLVAERVLFKRAKKHKKIQRHKRHVKTWVIFCCQRSYFRHYFLDQPIFRSKCSFYFEKDDFLMKRMVFL